MQRIIDLSHSVTQGTPVFPGDPEVKTYTHHTHESIGYLVTRFEMGTHTGTHVDVPLHRLAGGAAVDEVPLERWMGRALVLDLTALQPGEEIRAEHLAACEGRLDGCGILILKTNWCRHFGMEDFFSEFNGLTEEAVRWLIAHNISLIGLESPSVHPALHLQIHEMLLKNNILVVESLNNVDAITRETVTFFAAPLKLHGLDGSPVRAFAIEE